MRETVFYNIKCDYNRWRCHSAVGSLSSELFENQNLDQGCAYLTLVGAVCYITKLDVRVPIFVES